MKSQVHVMHFLGKDGWLAPRLKDVQGMGEKREGGREGAKEEKKR